MRSTVSGPKNLSFRGYTHGGGRRLLPPEVRNADAGTSPLEQHSKRNPPDTLMTAARPGGLRADSAVTAAPPPDTPMAIMRVGSAYDRCAIALSVAARASASASNRSRSDVLAHDTSTGLGPSDAPQPRRITMTASQPRRARPRA